MDSYTFAFWLYIFGFTRQAVDCFRNIDMIEDPLEDTLIFLGVGPRFGDAIIGMLIAFLCFIWPVIAIIEFVEFVQDNGGDDERS